MPGQKIIHLAKKGSSSSFLNPGFRRFSTAIPMPPRLFSETREGQPKMFLPALFVFGPAFLPGQQRNGFK
jgi:hypothetical protein